MNRHPEYGDNCSNHRPLHMIRNACMAGKYICSVNSIFSTCSEINFQLLFPQVCNTINEFYEGVELSIRLGAIREWVPIIFLFLNEDLQNEDIRIGDRDNLEIRGYPVGAKMFSVGTRTHYSAQVCDFDRQLDSVQLRWLQTSRFDDRNIAKDVWSIDDVQISYEPELGMEISLLEDSFNDNQLK